MAAAIHAAALTAPAFAAAAYPSRYPSWRHALFVLIDATLAWLFLRRPLWLVWPYAVLTVQVILGHGGAAWASWQRHERGSVIDAAAIIAIPLACALLVVDHRERGAAAALLRGPESNGLP